MPWSLTSGVESRLLLPEAWKLRLVEVAVGQIIYRFEDDYLSIVLQRRRGCCCGSWWPGCRKRG